jgi:hypothetical protein
MPLKAWPWLLKCSLLKLRYSGCAWQMLSGKDGLVAFYANDAEVIAAMQFFSCTMKTCDVQRS